MADYYTQEHEGKVGSIHTAEDARKAHHLASADPERDGTMTGPAHEEKYGLERAEHSAALWRAVGVHPTENRALVDGEDGAENLRGAELADESVDASDEDDDDLS
ncbi:MAG: hypothetical protein ACXVXZ_08890 [Mycobacteriaceae bacterium]